MRDSGSFRDPSGFIFFDNNILYRQINLPYQKQYDHLMKSGLYEALVHDGIFISHKEVSYPLNDPEAWCVIQPQRIPMISYPYEWSFGAYKDAALATLKIHRKAIDYGMILKDASAYNIQFVQCSPKLIDTLSFDFYEEGQPWVAYGQFCRHFLAPLLLMANVDIRLSQLMRIYIDGIPLDLASKLLKRKGGFTALQHIHWHAKLSEKHADDGKKQEIKRIQPIKKSGFIAIIDGLIRAVEGIRLKNIQTEWGDYYSETNYSQEASKRKEEILANWIKKIEPQTVWDFGANDGRYSRIAADNGAHVTAFDIDPIAVERNYQQGKKTKTDILPLVLDLTNPSPAIGFANQERSSIEHRLQPDCIMALALIHHLAISNNLPFSMISEWLSQICKYLIIEFVPKDDSQVQTLLRTRKDIFDQYTLEGFKAAFEKDFSLIAAEPITGSDRILFLCHSKKLKDAENFQLNQQ
jgi:hypothetical protein